MCVQNRGANSGCKIGGAKSGVQTWGCKIKVQNRRRKTGSAKLDDIIRGANRG